MGCAALADTAGVSGNRLATLFKSHVGVTPKRVARIYRFARLILTVDALRPVDWPALAHATGYFDQAHFGKEFKDFTGHTPTEYLALRRRFPADRDFPPDSGPMPAEGFFTSPDAPENDKIGDERASGPEENPWAQ